MIDPSFQGVNRLFVLSFEDRRARESYKHYFLPTVEIKDYNFVMDGRYFFDQPVKNSLRTYGKIRKTAIGQGDDYTTGCLIDYPYFKNYYKITATEKLAVDPKPIQRINFTGNLDRSGITHFFSLLKKRKK